MLGLVVVALLVQYVTGHSSRPSPSPSGTAFRKRFIVYGDFLSDDGTGAWSVSGNTLPVDPPYYQHQFTNGPVWSRLFAERHNFELRSFAVGGATTDNDFIQGTLGTDDSIPVPSVKVQVTQSLTKNVPRTLDLYAIVIGSNDFLQSDTPVSGTDVANLVEKRVSQLYKAGAKRVLLASLPDFSTAPFAQSQPAEVKRLITQYTVDLRAGLLNVVRRWNHLIRIEMADIFDAFNGVLANPVAFGFDPAYSAQPCYTGFYDNFEGTICEDPERHMFWDAIHPSAASHQVIADVFSEAYAQLQ